MRAGAAGEISWGRATWLRRPPRGCLETRWSRSGSRVRISPPPLSERRAAPCSGRRPVLSSGGPEGAGSTADGDLALLDVRGDAERLEVLHTDQAIGVGVRDHVGRVVVDAVAVLVGRDRDVHVR